MAGLVVAGLTTWQYEGTTAKKKHEHRISYLTGGGLLMEGLEARPTDRNPSVRQDRSHRRGAETPRKANVETLRALCRLSARIEECDWPRRTRRAFLAGVSSHP